eukprot:scaffold7234_cov30-Attheya_sp.AAC.1
MDGLDGLNTEETSIPLVALRGRSTSEHRSAAHANRYSVALGLELVDVDSFQPREGAKRRDDKTWETMVFVSGRKVFKDCVEWKGIDTRDKWQQHRGFSRARIVFEVG